MGGGHLILELEFMIIWPQSSIQMKAPFLSDKAYFIVFGDADKPAVNSCCVLFCFGYQHIFFLNSIFYVTCSLLPLWNREHL